MMNRNEGPSSPDSHDSVDLIIAESTCGLDVPGGLRARVEGAIGRSQRRRRRIVAGGGVGVIALVAVAIVAVGQWSGPRSDDSRVVINGSVPVIQESPVPEQDSAVAAVRFAAADNVLASPQTTTDPRITVVMVYPIGPASTQDEWEAGDMGFDSNKLHQQAIPQRSEL